MKARLEGVKDFSYNQYTDYYSKLQEIAIYYNCFLELLPRNVEHIPNKLSLLFDNDYSDVTLTYDGMLQLILDVRELFTSMSKSELYHRPALIRDVGAMVTRYNLTIDLVTEYTVRMKEYYNFLSVTLNSK